MTIETQYSDCGCALMRDDESGELYVQPGLGCDKEHDWPLIIAGIENDEMSLFN